MAALLGLSITAGARSAAGQEREGQPSTASPPAVAGHGPQGFFVGTADVRPLGKQGMIDRSLVDRAFTLDRQQGASLCGHVGSGLADFNYWVSAFMGMGPGGRTEDDSRLTHVARLQLNPLGQSVPFSGSHLGRAPQPALPSRWAERRTRAPSPASRNPGAASRRVRGR